MSQELSLKIAGEITLSPNPGASLKKWREIFNITQTELAQYLKVTPSTISDYEGNRRKSPGIAIIKRFVSSICDIDRQKGSWTLKKLTAGEDKRDIYEPREFLEPMKAHEFCKKIEAKILVNDKKLQNVTLRGCTFIDSMRAILELPGDEFIKIYGRNPEHAFLFTNVAMGRSPMVAIRVTGLTPRLVIFHNLGEVDKLALKLAEALGMPVAITMLPLDEIKKRITQEA